MTNKIENDENDSILESKEKVEENETIKKLDVLPNVVTVKYTRPPAFQKSGNLWKWNFMSSNNKQRPSRWASRGR